MDGAWKGAIGVEREKKKLKITSALHVFGGKTSSQIAGGRKRTHEEGPQRSRTAGEKKNKLGADTLGTYKKV